MTADQLGQEKVMTDYYLQVMQSPVGQKVIASLGLPIPPELRRGNAWQTACLDNVDVLCSASQGSHLIDSLLNALHTTGARIHVPVACPDLEALKKAASSQRVGICADAVDDIGKLGALVFDASGAQTIEALSDLHSFFNPVLKRLRKNGRIVVLGTEPNKAKSVAARAAARSLEGLTRSLGKEYGKKGITVQLIYVTPGAENRLAAPLRYCLSQQSAFVTGQVLRVHNRVKSDVAAAWEKPLAGQVALVTGAARGIGAGIAEVMAREGAKVICLDRPGEEESLQQVATAIGGEILAADITDPGAPKLIADYLKKNHKGVDIVVHNAGVTRDKTLARMSKEWWDMVININLASISRINDSLLKGIIRKDGRIVCVSSISGIAGNMGQTNYAVSKAGVIGYVEALSEAVADKGITVNAVAPGFIETKMTAAIPVAIREVGRRFNSLSQGGLPRDVAEAITLFASPGASGLSGGVLRVCGQNMLGA